MIIERSFSAHRLTPGLEAEVGTGGVEKHRTASADLLVLADRKMEVAEDKAHVAIAHLREAFKHKDLVRELDDLIRAAEELPVPGE